MSKTHTRGTYAARRLLAVLALSAPLLLGACDADRWLKVSAPSRIPAENLETPEFAALLVNGAIADFECAIGAFIMVEGIVGDEFGDAQLGAAGWPYDRRDANTQPGGSYGTAGCDANQVPGIYRPLSTARWAADNALKALEKYTPAEVAGRDSLVATAALYSGFSHAMLGMAMCSAALDEGPEIASAQLFARAEEKFTQAIDAAASVSAVKNAALVGRARVRLYQANMTGAAADAGQVPAGFRFDATASDASNRRYNRVYSSNVASRFYTIEPQARGLMTEGVIDPRTLVTNSGLRAADGQTTWIQTKYTAYGSPIPVARYEEAQLIIAEAEGGQGAIDIVNALRAAHGLPAYTGATDAASVLRLVLEERRRELFVEGQRLYDIHRHQLPLLPAPGTAYPQKGGSYGTTTCLPLPDVERFNNPNIGG